MDVCVLNDGEPGIVLERCRGYGFPAVGEVIGGVSFAALQSRGLGKPRTKDAALFRLFGGRVGQPRVGLSPRNSMQVLPQKLKLKMKFKRKINARRPGEPDCRRFGLVAIVFSKILDLVDEACARWPRPFSDFP